MRMSFTVTAVLKIAYRYNVSKRNAIFLLGKSQRIF